MENYTGRSIQVEGPHFEIAIVVRGINTLTGGDFANGPDFDILSAVYR